MQEAGILENLGIDWKILLGQIINFLVVLFVLKKFAYKPFLSVLNKRKIKENFSIEIPYWKKSLRECISVLLEM